MFATKGESDKDVTIFLEMVSCSSVTFLLATVHVDTQSMFAVTIFLFVEVSEDMFSYLGMEGLFLA